MGMLILKLSIPRIAGSQRFVYLENSQVKKTNVKGMQMKVCVGKL